jgi:riboflavin biosynthesis pyrimidine reductase
VAIAGGAATVNPCLAAGLIDELRTHIAPVTLGRVNASSTASQLIQPRTASTSGT